MDSLGLLATIPIFSRPPARWPEPELSTERYRGIKKGKLHCWDATGPARDAFEAIKQHISGHLDSAGIKVPSSSIIMFDIFMIGKSQTTARPYIMFSCKHRESRKAAVIAIKESNILNQCPPGIGVGDWDYPPHLKNLQQLAFSAVNPDDSIDTSQTDEVDTDFYNCRVHPLVDPQLRRIRVLRLTTRRDSAKDGHPCMATIGCIIEIHGKNFYLVPAHIFNATTPKVTSKETNILSVDSECDLDDFNSDNESLSGAQDEADFMSRYSASPSSSDGEEHWDTDDGNTISDGESIQGFDEWSQHSPRIGMTSDEPSASVNGMELCSIGHLAFSMNKPPQLSSHNLDYCLIEIDDGEKLLTDMPVLSPDTIGQLNCKSVSVVAATGSGNVLKGILSTQSSYIRLPNATKYISVLSVQFEASLQSGDCGSIVRDANTGKMYGHLVAGDLDSQIAFIVQATDVLDDAMAKFSGPETASAGHKALPSSENSSSVHASLAAIALLLLHYSVSRSYLETMNSTPRTCPPKIWNAEFLTDRNFKEGKPYVRLKSNTESEFGGIENFMQDSEESLPSNQVEEVVQFCQGVCPDDLKSSLAAAARHRRAWLDDRAYSPETGSGVPRKYTGNPLTPSQLYQLLQAQRYNDAVMPDTDRRLMYITKMNPHYVLAVTETTPWYEVESLRDALWKHLAFQMSIEVKVLGNKFPIFHLEIHLPYFSLRKAPPERHSQKADNGRNWTDLSFLKPKKDDLQHYGLYEAHTSVVIVGSDNHRWDGYCFTFDDEEDLLDEDSDADPISWNGQRCSNSTGNNEIVTGLTAAVASPIVIAATLYSMPDVVKLNPKSFFVVIITSVALMRFLVFIRVFLEWWPAINPFRQRWRRLNDKLKSETGWNV
ncbi:hypothetical protein TCE0_017f04308 [Talaromyces pinophilus]|uniref:Uncharacterized protein n=1 Tax=Talaromyces pinophilus TaxID=128442 RepID=A0A6V8H4N4_TALPI|nr:hypothetical protein TCE0_017f04308 [Talaromyces pinophilus]